MYRILVVDDERGLVEMLDAILDGEGYDVATASNGLEAIACIQRGWQPDVVLLDLQMPVLDGMAVCRWLDLHLAAEERPAVIILSASLFGSVDLPKVAAMLPKPYNLDIMLSLVSRFCNATPHHMLTTALLATA